MAREKLPSEGRLYKHDNVKFLLITLAVFAHFLELSMTYNRTIMYIIIYSFHMPVFIFLSGYFASYNPQKIVLNFVVPYFIFQLLYQLFSFTILSPQPLTNLSIWTFSQPFWLMWYMLALIVWHVLLPFFQTSSNTAKVCFILGAFFVSILAGFDRNLGYNFSLSRIVVYFPYFLLGHYSRSFTNNKSNVFTGSFSLVMVILSIIYIVKNVSTLDTTWFYNAVPYNPGTLYGWKFRAGFHFVALSWLSMLMAFTPNRKIPLVSYIGANTLPVFLLHGFVVKFIGHKFALDLSYANSFVLAGLAILTVLLLSSKPFSMLFSWKGRRS
ncbi:acyltransferase family protein [Clostridiaceae bacterium OttesenSCG-928-D20]|nr:acyltransferase family protein [Clostridiaceae bacterium OttesenSCG-928-D20]